ncbi:MAG: response regulator [Solimonas sp.]
MHRTALVVDDSKSARFALRRYLEGSSFKVDTADSAEQAYLALQKQRPDLIFLDHIMPDIDGFEALRQIKLDPATATIPVVICSSNEGDAFVAEARGQGAVDVLPKPPTPAHLLRVLASVEQQANEHEIEQSLAAAGDAPIEALLEAELAAPGIIAPALSPQTDHGPALAELRGALQALQARQDHGEPQAARLAELEARIGELEKRIDHELVALRGQLTRDMEEITQRVLSHVSDALLRVLGRG